MYGLTAIDKILVAGWKHASAYAIQWAHADFYVFWDPS